MITGDSAVGAEAVPGDAYRAGFDDVDEYLQWLALDGDRRLRLLLRQYAAQSDDQRVAGLVDTSSRNVVLLCYDRDGNRDVAREREVQHALDEIDRHYGIDPVTGDRLDLRKKGFGLILVSHLERAARVVQSILRHVLAPSSVGPDGSVGVARAVDEEAAARADHLGGESR